MVINIGALKSGDLRLVERDIEAVTAPCREAGVLSKVIIEAAYLTDEEKVTASTLAKAAGADFVKTSTGFGPGGATVADVALMRRVVGAGMGVKAAGGVRDFAAPRGDGRLRGRRASAHRPASGSCSNQKARPRRRRRPPATESSRSNRRKRRVPSAKLDFGRTPAPTRTMVLVGVPCARLGVALVVGGPRSADRRASRRFSWRRSLQRSCVGWRL